MSKNDFLLFDFYASMAAQAFQEYQENRCFELAQVVRNYDHMAAEIVEKCGLLEGEGTWLESLQFL